VPAKNHSREGRHTFEWRYDSTALNLDLGELSRAAVAGEPPEKGFHIQFGQHLFQTDISGPVGELWQELRNQTRRKPLRLVLRIDPETARPLLHLPWEYLHDGQGFLALNRRVLLSRMPYGLAPELHRTSAPAGCHCSTARAE